MSSSDRAARVRVCAVSYLNTVPLVWGMLHGSQKGLFELFFRLPAECADMVAVGTADIGIIPSFELIGRELGVVPGIGIACRGAVRSILLVSKVPWDKIRTLAVDSGSRTSVVLARVILARRFGLDPMVVRHPPDLLAMLANADSALIIGDPALRLDPTRLPFHVWDLGQEWMEMTGLPMVFAVWAGPRAGVTPEVAAVLQDSCAFGLRHLDEIVVQEAGARGFATDLVRRYLGGHIVFEVGAAERQGMDLFLQYATEVGCQSAQPAEQIQGV